MGHPTIPLTATKKKVSSVTYNGERLFGRDRLSPDDWHDAGATSVDERARQVVKETLSTHFPTHISPDIDALVRERFDIYLPVEELTRSSRW